ncbi:DoxX family protein [Candidatus Woesearchaeota archaeon]|nr:DoxX family protein [Candidatus Woesearchaeota archaeon]
MTWSEYSTFVLRLGLAALFFYTGVTKLLGLGQTAGFLEGLGFPMAMFFAVLLMVAELLGAILLLLGLLTRWASLWLLVIPLVGIFVYNLPQGAWPGLFNNLVVICALLSLSFSGAGAISLEGRK